MAEKEISEAKPDERHVVPCKYCEKHVSALMFGAYSYYDDEIGEPLRYGLLRCPHCDMPMLTAQDYIQPTGTDDWMVLDPRILYPESHKKLDWQVPISIRESYEEAVTGFAARTYVASAIMCRRTLEAIVAEKLGGPVQLAKGLDEMQKAGLIDQSLLEWADMLRMSGNRAAHEVGKKVLKQDALDLIEFCHALIEYIFTYKQRFEEFKARGGKKSA